MIDYYKIFGISLIDSNSKINEILTERQIIWTIRKRAQNQEYILLAEKMLHLISSAKEIFFNSENRKEYDDRITEFQISKIKDVEFTLNGNSIIEGWQELINGNFEMAFLIAQKAVHDLKNDHEVFGLLGNCYLVTNNSELAIFNFNKALKLNPIINYYYFDIGTAYEFKKNVTLASEQYKIAYKLNPSDPMLNAALGKIYLYESCFQESIKHFEFCVEKDPENRTYTWFLSQAYYFWVIQNYFIEDGTVGLVQKKIESTDTITKYLQKALVFNKIDESLRVKTAQLLEMVKWNNSFHWIFPKKISFVMIFILILCGFISYHFSYFLVITILLIIIIGGIGIRKGFSINKRKKMI
jgi:tetratricopeptide (TPR) repeat protein